MDVHERAEKAVELHLAGVTYDQIAHQLGYAHRSNARRAVQAALAGRRPSKARADALQETARTTVARLDAMLTGLWPAARRGDVQAVDRVLKIEEQRRQTLALLQAATEQQQAAQSNVTALEDFQRRLAERQRRSEPS